MYVRGKKWQLYFFIFWLEKYKHKEMWVIVFLSSEDWSEMNHFLPRHKRFVGIPKNWKLLTYHQTKKLVQKNLKRVLVLLLFFYLLDLLKNCATLVSSLNALMAFIVTPSNDFWNIYSKSIKPAANGIELFSN